LRVVTIAGDDMDFRGDSHIKAMNNQHLTPRRNMFDDDELEDKNLFD